MSLMMIGLLAACWFMAGLMWLTQLVSYPALASVPPEDAPAVNRSNQARLMVLSTPATLLALGAGVAVAIGADTRAATWMAIALVTVLMLVGFLAGSVQSAHHQRLMKSFDPEVHRRMVSGNWVTTVGWSIAAFLSVGIGYAV
ncbi:hypothetical protein [Ornithinimicrobium pratense]|uniref:DUF1772 domain-containing protein n=1 Tax=Ornithinimicrobium pratense TaxID=2593973 RepID=A0A5J6V8N5_9MICO|nr:hypothetical protein [Ornithinimicrobium pratense]QFG69443.1 hypothetical protein FY030_12680 [Ornithinimicrobium pratense]